MGVFSPPKGCGANYHRPATIAMSAPLSELETTNRILKRAQYEAFAFTVTDDGVVVRNESHADPADHEYRVTVKEGIPVTCECPADEHYEGACKHRVAVAIREPVLQAATSKHVTNDDSQGRVRSDQPC